MTSHSQTNTGLFCTPEINDRVFIHYPTERNFSIKDKNKNIFHLYINNDYLSVDNAETVIRNKEMIDMSSQNIITISSDKILEFPTVTVLGDLKSS